MPVGARKRGLAARGSAPRLGQHRLNSRRFAASLVARARVASSDLVVEIGSGDGILTDELARRAAHVLAVELDPRLAVGLVERFSDAANVWVVAGDFVGLPLPQRAFRAFGNIPFAHTTSILRRLLDPHGSAMVRADLIVQWHVALKRARPRHGNLLNMGWAPWWEFTMGSRIAARRFEPRPTVDAAVLTVTRRKKPLLPPREWHAYNDLVGGAFAASEVRAVIKERFPRRRVRDVAGELGIPADARAPDLNVDQWTALYRAAP